MAGFPGLRLLRALVTLPLVLPPVVGGVALLLAFGRNGFVGRYLDQWFGVTIPFTPLAVVMAETFVAMPFLVVTVEGALRSADRGFEEAAATLGASRMTVFRRVTLPLVAPSLVAGAVLCWARALGEFGATITFAGSFPGRTQTMPIAVYYALETDPDAAIALSLVLLLVSVVVLVGAARPVAARRLAAVTVPDRARGACDVDAEVRPRRRSARRSRSPSAPGEVLGVLGPNGSGKSTLLRRSGGSDAGVGAGRIRLDGQVLDDAGTGAFVEAADRPVGFVFQDYRLFPHLSVLDNVAFSPRARRAAAAAGARGGAGAGSTGSASPTSPSRRPGGPVRRPGAAGGAGPRPGRRTARCCCSTSRCRRWTPAPGSTCRPSCAGTSPTSPGRACWSRTTRWRRWSWPTGCWCSRTAGSCRRAPRPQVARRPATEYVARLVGLNLYAGRADGADVTLDGGGSVRRARPRRSTARCSSRCAPPRSVVSTAPPDAHQRAQHLAGHGRRADPADRPGPARPRRASRPPLVDVTPAAVAELGLRPGSAGLAVGQGHRPRGVRPRRSPARLT